MRAGDRGLLVGGSTRLGSIVLVVGHEALAMSFEGRIKRL